MNAIDAVEVVLAEAGEPLGYREITRRMLARGLWATKGLTPEETINARLAVDIKDQGAGSRFQRTGPGVFALRKWGLPEVAARGGSAKSRRTAEGLEHEGTKAREARGARSREGREGGAGALQLPMAPEADAGEAPMVKVEPLPPEPEKSPKKPSLSLSFTDAAEAVLEQFGHKQPMHYKTITEKAQALELVSTKGLTPAATLYAQVLTETKRRAQRGEPPRFVIHGKGLIGLAKWTVGGLAFQIEQHNEGVRRKLHARLLAMDPQEFQELILQLLVELGFDDVGMTSFSGDGGIDARATLVVGEVIRTRMAVQVKRWKRNVQAPTVQQVRGSLGTHEQGLIVTTSDFSKGARAEAERANAVPVALMNGEQLVKLLVENDIGVHRTQYDLIELEGGR